MLYFMIGNRFSSNALLFKACDSDRKRNIKSIPNFSKLIFNIDIFFILLSYIILSAMSNTSNNSRDTENNNIISKEFSLKNSLQNSNMTNKFSFNAKNNRINPRYNFDEFINSIDENKEDIDKNNDDHSSSFFDENSL